MIVKTDNPVVQEIKNKLLWLKENNKIEPVKATFPGGVNLYMERINGTSKYLSHLKKVIYDVRFENCYYHNNRIPKNCFAVENTILRIEESCNLENMENKFLEILNRPNVEPVGIRFFLDGKLHLKDVPFLKSDRIRDNILQQRHDGTMIYDVLTIIDPSGNKTEFYASPAVAKRMKHLKEKIKL